MLVLLSFPEATTTNIYLDNKFGQALASWFLLVRECACNCFILSSAGPHKRCSSLSARCFHSCAILILLNFINRYCRRRRRFWFFWGLWMSVVCVICIVDVVLPYLSFLCSFLVSGCWVVRHDVFIHLRGAIYKMTNASVLSQQFVHLQIDPHAQAWWCFQVSNLQTTCAT